MPTDFERMLHESWAMEPQEFDALVRAYLAEVQAGRGARFLAYPESNLRFTAGADASASTSGPRPYQRAGGVAIIEVRGTLVKRTPECAWCAVRAYHDLRDELAAALADGAVRAVLLDIDSPGGLVNGVAELGEFLAGAAKPVYAYSDGLMLSGAYWLGAATGRVALAPTAKVGSVGVLMLHQDWSKWLDRFGLAMSYVTAGTYKAAANAENPLSDRDRAYLQERIDQSNALFVGAVAAGMGLDPGQYGAWGEGKVFNAAEGVALGLAGRIVNDRSAMLRIIQEETRMNKDELRAQHPGLHAELLEEGRTAGRAEAEKAQAEAWAKARQEGSAQALGLAAAVLGDEAVARIAPLAEAGLTPEQARAVLAATQAPAAAQDPKAQILAQLRQDTGGVPMGGAPAAATENQEQAARMARMAAIPSRA